VRQRYPAPPHIRATFGASVSIEKSGLPPWLLSQLKHLASLHNPQFYQRERLRLSTFKTPRFIKCYGEDLSHLHLPRGVSEELQVLCEAAGSHLAVTDVRPTPKRLSLKFTGQLTSAQRQAMRQVLAHEMGVLVAPPGAGKTIMGCFAIAKRNVPTLILAHRKPILEQWRAQLMDTLGLSSREIGQVGGGRNKPRGVVDLGMIQSLARCEDLEAFFSTYGFLIVDECHHLPAFTFEAAVKQAPVRSILGLTATPYRRDGLQDIITMQCGPIRCKMQDIDSDLLKQVVVRETSFAYASDDEHPIQEIFRELVNDPARNELIQQDVRQALSQGRRCLILSQWRAHCRLLAEGLTKAGKAPFVLEGTLGKKDRTMLLQCIQATPREDDLVVIATGQYLGEGFDCPQIDTLFLAFPISFKGKLVQYVGRTLRSYEGKKRVLVYDYADVQVPVLNAMHLRRLKTYKTLGFTQAEPASQEVMEPSLFPGGGA
jgi:superfamily II DNA or RNA helicase